MIGRVRAMPGGIRLFLGYAALILVGIGLSLRFVVDAAIAAPVSPLGILVMVLLAYTIFTTTLVIQRKQAGFGLALGLASLTIPLVILLAISPVHPAAPFFAAALGILLKVGIGKGEPMWKLTETAGFSPWATTSCMAPEGIYRTCPGCSSKSMGSVAIRPLKSSWLKITFRLYFFGTGQTRTRLRPCMCTRKPSNGSQWASYKWSPQLIHSVALR
jgi:hypothetical protein